MNEPQKFKKLRDLSSELNSRIIALSEGNLSAEGLDELTTQGRELYERLIVLRYKAFDATVKGTPVDAVQEEKSSPAIQEPIHFRVETKPVSPTPPPPPVNQVSLIDAIEEVSRETAPQPPVRTAENTFHTAESLNEKLSRSIPAQNSIASQLEHTPIQDLKRAITLNQRFQFSKELFKGNNQDYEVSIERLNTSSRDEAMRTLDTLRSKYAWNDDSPVAQDFVDLVERRHK